MYIDELFNHTIYLLSIKVVINYGIELIPSCASGRYRKIDPSCQWWEKRKGNEKKKSEKKRKNMKGKAKANKRRKYNSLNEVRLALDSTYKRQFDNL